ncbi:hypothetical protein DXC39_20895 [Hungatella hathewayi]|uniref:Uncharacterized protein n=1 Tax=Hungatella hathewayi TaxID=154046 RepID=A0A3E4U1V0_9FIRM|nr:hypothetical protein DXC39_20895 [Hungatella hathewayi]RHM72436.1 hypothetical protein DWZ48_24320 [Hungatella hathewayi]
MFLYFDVQAKQVEFFYFDFVYFIAFFYYFIYNGLERQPEWLTGLSGRTGEDYGNDSGYC